MRRLLSALFVAACLPVAAQAQVFDCTPENYGTGGFISTRIILGLDRKANAGSAFDYYIRESHKAPIPVTLTKRSDTSYEFSWKLRNVQTSNAGSAVLSQKVTLNLSNRTFTLRGRLHGSDNNIFASGTCKQVK